MFISLYFPFKDGAPIGSSLNWSDLDFSSTGGSGAGGRFDKKLGLLEFSIDGLSLSSAHISIKLIGTTPSLPFLFLARYQKTELHGSIISMTSPSRNGRSQGYTPESEE